MKNLYIILMLLLCSAGLYAQSPEKMSYQAILRDAADALIVNQGVGIQVSVLQSSASGTAVYVETHSPTTNANGLVSLEIGTGTPTTGTFSAIDWSAGPYFLKRETDPTASGGTNYTITGTTELLSVPFAMHATTSERVGTCGLKIGDTHEGGIIFYLDASGCHGLVAAASDQSTGIAWYNGSYVDTYAYGNGIGAGEGNSQGIRRWQVTCSSCYASELCQDLSLGGFNDWYLPSKYELNLMYENIGQGNSLGLGNVGGFGSSYYWSSTEFANYVAWMQYFGNGVQDFSDKGFSRVVRAVRAF